MLRRGFRGQGMTTMDFMQALRQRWNESGSLVCVGLDPEPAKFPPRFTGEPDAMFAFCRDIVDATAQYACAFKPQIAPFAARGAEDALERPVAHIHATPPRLPVILAAKRGAIARTPNRTRVRKEKRVSVKYK